MTTIAPLTQNNAELIANTWHYDGIYNFYDMSSDPEDYEEILSPKLRANHYFQVVAEGQLTGFFMVEPTDQPSIVEVGLGMKPSLTDQGKGQQFVQLILAFVNTHYHPETVIFDVAEFNIRAQTCYRNLGFMPVKRHWQATNGGQYPFVEMQLILNTDSDHH
ncbi:GNAT family N-acetyltransferase [Furfurilactobacillus rossiae]|uniref:Ribosomal-protein-alanine acetyltransferase n=1 Tax=Furfurilactobacillus rossiae DSM 15814 TaxID=1114972 RepID=A0A0R1R8J9_9LACO|nr:GNAT family protein [Furfurilactobacillus rossiae]KRL53049.1 ribosomal-protein-alanine acetyltransferase [Furfurilactobacillus rossiae DSM 15814]MCF6166429.1 GNAT family N-acetyltransferase [Furfurilactobacillus rossiae]QFR66396.1 GNAT family N-acetyltransferase [Furfurilactobacillus rossiae]QLE61851.1 Ribosomal-protein-alanine acetyltransferase [Furfurilactobacillus rossiae]QLE64651.1 Ribosomal-protein-alanine acetyltransferase [Furfurilactobacillus rossiae]